MNRWLYLVVCNTPPIDWLGFLGLWDSFFERIETDIDLGDMPETGYNRRMQVFSFTENVLVYLALGVVFGILFKAWSTASFLELMAKIWGIAYVVGIMADALLIHRGLYFPPYKRFKGVPLMQILKLYVITIYHSAIYVVLGIVIGRIIL
ncbi:MAG: hypothetical protein ACE5PO_01985 [Candidatus Bathyarchaeia archaeon]